MQFVLKLLLTNVVIIACVLTGKKFPSLAGLIATMPLTSLIVLIWLHSDNPGDYRLLTLYTEGVLWGIIPTILFFAVAYLCFTRQLSLPLTLSAGFGVWLLGALIHQWLLR
ncbi:MAG: DUF3147 family protein [Deltaproteobacteria bacterium]|nr:DUF3147 family protein [Deltaproteobacteria bacterium]